MEPLGRCRGDLLDKAGRTTEAREEFERAAALTQNEREREVLRGRAAACARAPIAVAVTDA